VFSYNRMCSLTSNKVMVVQLDDEKGVFKESACFDHPYPTTKVLYVYTIYTYIYIL